MKAALNLAPSQVGHLEDGGEDRKPQAGTLQSRPSGPWIQDGDTGWVLEWREGLDIKNSGGGAGQVKSRVVSVWVVR